MSQNDPSQGEKREYIKTTIIPGQPDNVHVGQMGQPTITTHNIPLSEAQQYVSPGAKEATVTKIIDKYTIEHKDEGLKEKAKEKVKEGAEKIFGFIPNPFSHKEKAPESGARESEVGGSGIGPQIGYGTETVTTTTRVAAQPQKTYETTYIQPPQQQVNYAQTAQIPQTQQTLIPESSYYQPRQYVESQPLQYVQSSSYSQQAEQLETPSQIQQPQIDYKIGTSTSQQQQPQQPVVKVEIINPTSSTQTDRTKL